MPGCCCAWGSLTCSAIRRSLAAAGDAIFSNLGLLFAIGVAVGLARENHGAAGLASVVGYLVATKGAEVLIAVPPDLLAGLEAQARDLATAAYKARELAKLSVPAGIISGVLAGVLYNRYSNIQLPELSRILRRPALRTDRRGSVGLLVAAAFGYGWPVLERGMDVAQPHGAGIRRGRAVRRTAC